jgi:nucleotide-binding universal stress UspA family protein
MDTIKKIVIAIDDGPASEKIAMAAFQLGQQLAAEMALVSIVDTALLITDAGVTPPDLANIMRNDYKKSQQLLIEKVFKGNKVLSFVEEGRPYEGILEVAEEWDADLIVLGTHGRTGLSHLLLGSVAEKLIRHSPKPLFIIPTRL